jgi:hypothetical protein
MMNQQEIKIESGVCLSEWNGDFDFSHLHSMKKSFCVLRICQIDCRTGTIWIDNRFKEYANACNELSIPWVGYIYLQYKDSNIGDALSNIPYLPNHAVWDMFKDVKFGLPYITFIFNFDLPDFDLPSLDYGVNMLEKAIAPNTDKKLTTCVGVCGLIAELNTHSQFKYPLYTEVYLPNNCKSFSVPNNAILCWCGDATPTPAYSASPADGKIEITKNEIGLDSIVALGEMAEAIRNYGGVG